MIRAEAETCFLTMLINIQMLLLFLMINSNLVLTKVETIPYTKHHLSFGVVVGLLVEVQIEAGVSAWIPS